jgi:outer membrane lipoprotein-sorting protein
MCRRLLTAVVALALLPAAARPQTVDEIISKNVQAHGGMEKMNSVQSRIWTAKFSDGSFKADIRWVNKRPNEVREEFILQGMTQVRAYDGKAGWQLDPFQGRREAELLAEDDVKDLAVDADIDGPLVNYKEKGHQAELMGHDSVEGTDCYKVKLTMKNGDIRTYYIDTDSYLELKVSTQTFVRGAPRESETYYGDYDQVGGIYYPFAIEQGQKGNPDRSRLTIEKMELNPPVEDALFKMPPANAAAGHSNRPK